MAPKFTPRTRSTKIVATLGPTSDTKEKIKELIIAGVDVLRFNFSHGTAEDHTKRMNIVREIEQELGHPICVLADLQGPKLRLATFKDGAIDIKAGDKLQLDMDLTPGDNKRVGLPHPEILNAVVPESEILLDDGKVRLRVDSVKNEVVQTTVLAGTRLSNRKGVNVPNVLLPISALTEKDHRDLETALKIGADWIALSFVQRPEDVLEAKKIINGRAAVCAKLEKPSAITYLDEIIAAADGVMVARGDLGVEMLPEDVPPIQKLIVSKARTAGKPVIVATQMLESMISAPAPTRAEASDVATAIYDGADAIMLSAETASGEYPVEAVTMMDRIARRIQTDPSYIKLMKTWHPELTNTTSDAISAAARQAAETIRANLIVTYTTVGSTTYRAARERPQIPILALTPNLNIARRLCLCFGVHSVHAEGIANFDNMVEIAANIACDQKLAQKGEKMVITAGVPFGVPGGTNILRIAEVGEGK